MTDIYSPKLKTDSNYGLGETVKTQINNEAVIPILADSIYKDPKSSIRELYNNEITACKKAKLKDQKIIIKLDSNTKELSIQGINSLGISKEVFTSIISVMGNSGNNQGDTIGYFGLGFFSHVKISEKMIVHTKTEKEEFSFISKSGISFEILPNEFHEKLKSTGTKLILTVKDDTNLSELIDFIKDIVLLSTVKTELIYDDNWIELKQFDNLKQFVKDQYSDYHNNNFPDYCLRMYQEINEDFELIITKSYPRSKNKSNYSFLVTSPISIKSDDFTTDYTSYNYNFYLRIKNERKFKPHVSRDFLETKTEKLLRELIDPHYRLFEKDDASIKIDPHSKDDYKKLDITKFMNNKEKHFYHFYYSIHCHSNYSKPNPIFRMLETTLSKFKTKIKDVCLVSNVDEKESNLFEEYGILIIGVNKANRDLIQDTFKGFIDKKDVYKKYGLKKIVKEKIDKEVFPDRIIYHGCNSCPFVISIKRPMSQNRYPLKFVKESIKGENIFTVSEIPNISTLKNKIFLTNEGYKTIKELDNTFTIIDSYVMRKQLPKKDKWAIVKTDDYTSEAIKIYLNIEHGSFEKFNPYYKDLKTFELFKKLENKSLIQVYRIDNLENYILIKNLIEVKN